MELIYDKIEITIIDRQCKAAQELLNQHAEDIYEDKVKILKKAGYSDKLVEKVMPKEKNKGLLGILKSG